MSDKETISNMRNNIVAILQAKASDNSDGIDKQLLANMKTHYSSIMTEGATNFGGDVISQSIFSKIDTDKNKTLSLAEISSANLDEILLDTLEKNKPYISDMNEYFGESYTESASKTDPNSSKSTTEQIVNNNLNQAIAQILEYARNNPDDTKVQEYAKKLNEMINQNSIQSGDIDYKYSIGTHLSATKNTPNGVIIIDNRDQLKNLNARNVLHTLLHELGHAINGDDLDSVAEETMVETSARELAKKISGTDVYRMPIEQFAKQYQDDNYPVASPGTHNIPIHAGITTKYVPEEVTMQDGVLTIRSGIDEDGNRIEDRITYSKKTDADGNPIPKSAKRVIINSQGKEIFSSKYGKYDNIKKSFTESGYVDLEQKMFENERKGRPMLSDFNGLS